MPEESNGTNPESDLLFCEALLGIFVSPPCREGSVW